MASFGRTFFGSHRGAPALALNMCQGKALFPRFGTYRAGVSVSGMGRTLFNGNANFGLFKASASTSYFARLGVCGPAWASGFVLTGSDLHTTNPTIRIEENQGVMPLVGSRERDAWTGGFFAGAIASISTSVSIQVFCGVSVRCRRWSCSVRWRYCNAGGFSAGVTIDLIALFFAGAGGRPPRSDFTGASASIPGYQSSLNVVDEGTELLNSSSDIKPAYTINVNLINFIPKIGQINWKLGRFGTGFEFGPFFQVDFPLRFRITHFGANVGGAWHQHAIGNRSGHTLQRTGGSSALRNPGRNRGVARVQWEVRTRFVVGIYAAFNLLWVISIGVSVGWPVSKLIPGFRGGWYRTSTDIVSQLGSTSTWNAVVAGTDNNDCGCDDPMLADGDDAPTFVFAPRDAVRA